MKHIIFELPNLRMGGAEKALVSLLKTIDNDNNKKAADINKDGYIDSGDSYILKKHVMKIENISL